MYSLKAYQCIVNSEVKSGIMIGGRVNGKITPKTWFIKYENELLSVEEGPNLVQARERHSCLIIENDDQKLGIIVGGEYHGISLKSTEILDLKGSPISWSLGTELSLDYIIDSTLYQHKSYGCLLIGGIQLSNNILEHRILEFDSITFAWQEIYSEPRNTHLPTFALPISNNLVKCEENN